MSKTPDSRFARILCAVDFSECSQVAARHAVALAGAFDAELTALHVMPHSLTHPDLFPYLDEPILASPEIRERIGKRLETFVQDHMATAGMHVKSVVEAGDTARQIVRHIARSEVDLVVMGTHGRRGFRRWLLGSVADDVLRRALGCILVVGSSGVQRTFPYRRIVCSVDFSDASMSALEHAKSLADSSRGELIVIHVTEPEMEDAREEPSRDDVLRRLARHLPPDAMSEARCVVERGTPHERIRELADAREADLIVAGASGRGAVDVLLFGSTVSQLVRTAERAVLVIGSTEAQSRERVLADLDSEGSELDDSDKNVREVS